VGYSDGIGFAAIFLLAFAIVKGKGSGPWMIAVFACALIVGTAPMITGILPGIVNGFATAISQAVFGQGVGAVDAYSPAVILICLVLAVYWLRDGHVSKAEQWGFVVCAFILGSTPLIQSWYTPMVNSVWAMIPV
jgi:hypothetical protein